MKPFIELVARLPGALETLSPTSLRGVLARLDIADTSQQSEAAVTYQPAPQDALRLLARHHDVLGHLTQTEVAYAESRYDEPLSNALFADDPEPLARVLGAPADGTHRTEDETPLPRRSTGGYGLFPHQRRAVLRVQRLLAPADTRALLHMPTGAGKTRSAMHVVCDHLRVREPGVVLWAASTKELLEQGAREFDAAWRHLGNRDVGIGHGWDGETAAAALTHDGFVAATLQGLHAMLRRSPEEFDRLADRCTLMVFDEAHQAIARTYSAVTERVADRARLLGLSATPGRTALGSEEDDRRLADFFGRKVMLDTADEGDPNPVRYLIAQGYLARTEFRTVQVDRPASSRSSQDTVPDEVYTQQVVELITDHAPKHPRIMVFAASVEHARVIAAAATACGVPARYVVGEMPPQARHRAIDWFKEPAREARAIVNFGVLTTGFDAPDVSVAVIARPTESLVLYSQMVGRAIRGPEAGGTDEAVVLTVVDNDNPGFSNVAAAFENWEQLWEMER